MKKKFKILFSMMLIISMSIINLAPYAIVKAGITDDPGTTRSRTTIEKHYDDINHLLELDVSDETNLSFDINSDEGILIQNTFGVKPYDFDGYMYYTYDEVDNKFVECDRNLAIFRLFFTTSDAVCIGYMNPEKYPLTTLTYVKQNVVEELVNSHTYFTGVTNEEELIDGELIPVAYYEYREDYYYNRHNYYLNLTYGTSSALKGDINLDGKVNADDAAEAIEIFKTNALTTENIAKGDMDGNGVVNAEDSALIIEYFKTHH